MEKTTRNIDAFITEAGDYIENRVELFKLKLADKTSDVASTTASGLVVGIMALLFITLISIGLSLWLGELTGKSYYGFLIVGGFYALLAAIIYAGRGKLLKEPVSNIILKSIFK